MGRNERLLLHPFNRASSPPPDIAMIYSLSFLNLIISKKENPDGLSHRMRSPQQWKIAYYPLYFTSFQSQIVPSTSSSKVFDGLQLVVNAILHEFVLITPPCLNVFFGSKSEWGHHSSTWII